MSGVGLEVDARPTGTARGETHDQAPAVGEGTPRRFVGAAIIGSLVASVPYLWILTNDWTGHYSLARRISYLSSFYDNQAQSIIHGHLWVHTGSLGIEGFLHDGRTYTYFGLLLSLLRIPFLAVGPHLSGRLTAPSMLVAWMLTLLFASLLIWRVRVLLRGSVAVGWAEAVSLGVLMTTILGGSVLLFLGSAPWVYDEDIAWTVPITTATLFVFLGILDRPSRGRVAAGGALLLAGVLDRPSPALACIVGALLIAGWFFLGYGGPERKRWGLPMVIIGVVPFAVSTFLNWVKFGTFLNGLPLAQQVWTQQNAHRRAFLAATGGKGYSVHFLPTQLWAYLQPFGIRAQPTFPFLSLPIYPPHVYGGYIVDILYPTASVPGSMPLLFLLSCWALAVAFRPGAGRGAKLMRIPLIAAAGATAVDFLLGYTAPRYLGDFLPFLILGAAVGMVDLWRRWEHRGAARRRLAMAGVVVLGAFCVAANVGIALTPTTEWTNSQATNYLKAVRSVSGVTGDPLARQVMRGSVMPYQAPAGEVFIAGDCAGLYLSSGKPVSADPTLQLEHRMWVPAEQGPGINNRLGVTFNGSPAQLGRGVPIFTVGRNTLIVRSAGHGRVQYVLDEAHGALVGKTVTPKLGKTYHFLVQTDPFLHRVVVNSGQVNVVSGVLTGVGPGVSPVVVHATPAASAGSPPVTVVHLPGKVPDMSVCRSILHDH